MHPIHEIAREPPPDRCDSRRNRRRAGASLAMGRCYAGTIEHSVNQDSFG